MFVSVIFFIIVSFTVGYIQKTTFYIDKDGRNVGEIEYGFALGRYGFKDIRRLESHEWITEKNWNKLSENVASIKENYKKYPLDSLPKDITTFIDYPSHENYAAILYNYFVIKYAYKHQIADWDSALIAVVEKFLHLIPKIFFLLMPILAVLLNVFFFRKKGYGFIEHGVMSLHTHIFLFLCGILQLSLGSLLPLENTFWLFLFYVIIPLVHFTIATHRFYQTSWLRTMLITTMTWGIYWILVFTISIITLLFLILYT